MQPEAINPVNANDALRMVARKYLAIDDYVTQTDGRVIFHGRLIEPAHTIYRQLRRDAEAVGFTPFLRRASEGVELIMQPGVVERKEGRIRTNIILFVVTVCTVLLNGALSEVGGAFNELVQHPAKLVLGLPFMLTLLGILGTHEMGHFVVGRLRGAPMSWPYFIPMPPFFTGTLGAVIVQREPLEDRRTLLQVGIAGPLAGLAVAIPLLFLGLSHVHVGTPDLPPGQTQYIQEGNSILYATTKYLIFHRWLPGNGVDVQLDTPIWGSVAWGAWIGLLITMVNLLPIGQLDGGHVAFSLLGRKADYLAYAIIAGCVILGISQHAYNWFVWAIMPMLFGIRHPEPLNDVTELDRKHTALAVFGLVVFVLLFMPNPLVTRTIGQ